jgi:hypothetical protein
VIIKTLGRLGGVPQIKKGETKISTNTAGKKTINFIRKEWFISPASRLFLLFLLIDNGNIVNQINSVMGIYA